jgi:hypothetical protein
MFTVSLQHLTYLTSTICQLLARNQKLNTGFMQWTCHFFFVYGHKFQEPIFACYKWHKNRVPGSGASGGLMLIPDFAKCCHWFLLQNNESYWHPHTLFHKVPFYYCPAIYAYIPQPISSLEAWKCHTCPALWVTPEYSTWHDTPFLQELVSQLGCKVSQILEMIWTVPRDHVPSPASLRMWWCSSLLGPAISSLRPPEHYKHRTELQITIHLGTYCGVFASCKNGWATETAVSK